MSRWSFVVLVAFVLALPTAALAQEAPDFHPLPAAPGRVQPSSSPQPAVLPQPAPPATARARPTCRPPDTVDLRSGRCVRFNPPPSASGQAPAAHSEPTPPELPLTSEAQPQVPPKTEASAQPQPTPKAAPAPPTEWWTATSAITMCSIVLAFGILVILISCALALRRIDKDTILKIVVIPMSVMLAVFLVVAGYSDSQIAPAMGLLGTIVGYVLGTAKRPEVDASANAE